MNWLKSKIRSWLGVDKISRQTYINDLNFNLIRDKYDRMEKVWEQATTEIVDVGLRSSNTRIVIASNLGIGFCKWYESDFQSISELNNFCEMLARTEIQAEQPFIDAPWDDKDGIMRDRKNRGLKT